jgi:hypothetical protein
MAPGSTQSLTEMSTRCISWGKGGRCVRLTLTPSCVVVIKSGNLNFLEPSGPLQACNGTALLLLEGVRGQRHAPAAPYPPEKIRHPLYRRLGGPQGLSGQVRKTSLPPGFDPRTVQPVCSRYTDWAIPGCAYRLWRFSDRSFDELVWIEKIQTNCGVSAAKWHLIFACYFSHLSLYFPLIGMQ